MVDWLLPSKSNLIQNKNLPHFELVHTIIHQQLKLGFGPKVHLGTVNWLRSLSILGLIDLDLHNFIFDFRTFYHTFRLSFICIVLCIFSATIVSMSLVRPSLAFKSPHHTGSMQSFYVGRLAKQTLESLEWSIRCWPSTMLTGIVSHPRTTSQTKGINKQCSGIGRDSWYRLALIPDLQQNSTARTPANKKQ